jgi:hypothetical protein
MLRACHLFYRTDSMCSRQETLAFCGHQHASISMKRTQPVCKFDDIESDATTVLLRGHSPRQKRYRRTRCGCNTIKPGFASAITKQCNKARLRTPCGFRGVAFVAGPVSRCNEIDDMNTFYRRQVLADAIY